MPVGNLRALKTIGRACDKAEPLCASPDAPGVSSPKDGLATHNVSKFMTHSEFNQRLSLRCVACELAVQSGGVPSSAIRYLGDRVSVLVFAGAAFHELHKPSSEARLEDSNHPRRRTADHYAGRDRDGQERGSRLFMVHIACLAVTLRRQDIAQGIGRE